MSHSQKRNQNWETVASKSLDNLYSVKMQPMLTFLNSDELLEIHISSVIYLLNQI